jgi:hypothetical protein
MIRAEDIPDDVVEAAAWAACDDINGEGAWDETPFRHRPMWRSAARACIAAALNAWPGMRKPMRVTGLQSESWLELPLPQKETSE